MGSDILLSVVVQNRAVIEKIRAMPGVLEVHVESSKDGDEEE